jgi:glycosyltransferase involved in cell wall biosynthesis
LKRGVPENKLRLVYAGVRTKDFRFKYGGRDKIVVTIAGIFERNIKRKGLDAFVKLGKYLPDYKFYLVGSFMDDKSVSYLKWLATDNVVLTDFVSEEELLFLLHRASIYCQFSEYEAFGSGLVEAMSCGCLPICALGENDFKNMVGKNGYCFAVDDLSVLAGAIKYLHQTASENKRLRCSEYVYEHFDITFRFRNLKRVFDALG